MGPSRRDTLVLLSVAFAATVAIAVTADVGILLLSGVRAYVGGEGLWSKAQKDSVNWLHQYAESRDESAFRSYLAAIQVPLGDRTAREELEKGRFDPAAVRRGFILGRNHPDDVESMTVLYRQFRRVSYMEKAIDTWKRGDRFIAALVDSGRRLHEAVQAGAPREALAPILAQIDSINVQVTPLEDDFSFTLGEAARWARGIVLKLVVGAAVLLLSLSAFVVRRLGRELAASEERYRAVTETVTEGILAIDEEGRIVFANSAAARILGRPAARLAGSNFEDLIPPNLRGEPGSALRQCVGEKGSADLSAPVRLRAAHGDGHEIPLEVCFAEGRESGRRIFTGIVRDITLRMQEEAQIERLAYHDSLTSLPNRALFGDRLNQALSRARRRGERIALLFVDLDDFKVVNDSFGHVRGDHVLREVGGRLKSGLRGQDTAARVGGDEFLVLLPELEHPDVAERVAEKILGRIAAPIDLGERHITVTASIGISLFPADGLDAETLVRNADVAMYRAKEKGGRTVELCGSASREPIGPGGPSAIASSTGR